MFYFRATPFGCNGHDGATEINFVDRQIERSRGREREGGRERERKDSLASLDALLSGLSKYFIAR